MNDCVRLEISDKIATITFNRPEQMNVLDERTAVAFEEAVSGALAQSETRVVLMRGAGQSFMAGGDLAYFQNAADKPAAAARVIDPVHRALKALCAAPAITIAAAQGAVAGGGMSIFMGADLGIATQSAHFNMAYARIAATPDCGGSWALPRLVGLRRAMALVLLSETLTAQRAHDLGIVTTVVPDHALDAEANKMAERLAAGPACAQGKIKALLRRAFETDYAAQLDSERADFFASAGNENFNEGLCAFLEKRRPQY
ncbi:MAG: enoyl-CoA hydratase [Robiginitomaculum sp.]|nr:MAG: enoyl-CoA hydratase [Robiginitomaculum sp.]